MSRTLKPRHPLGSIAYDTRNKMRYVCCECRGLSTRIPPSNSPIEYNLSLLTTPSPKLLFQTLSINSLSLRERRKSQRQRQNTCCQNQAQVDRQRKSWSLLQPRLLLQPH